MTVVDTLKAQGGSSCNISALEPGGVSFDFLCRAQSTLPEEFRGFINSVQQYVWLIFQKNVYIYIYNKCILYTIYTCTYNTYLVCMHVH